MTLAFAEQIAADHTRARATAFSKLAALLRKALTENGRTTPDDRAELLKFAGEVGATPADVEKYYRAIERHNAAMAAGDRLEAVAANRDEVERGVLAWHARKAAALAAFDTEGAPLLEKMNNLQRELTHLQIRAGDLALIEREFPQLFGLANATPAPLTPDEHRETARLGLLEADVRNLVRSISEGRVRREKLDEPSNDVLAEGLARGLFLLEDLPADQRADPRIEKARKLAAQIRRRDEYREHLNLQTNNFIDRAVTEGWITLGDLPKDQQKNPKSPAPFSVEAS